MMTKKLLTALSLAAISMPAVWGAANPDRITTYIPGTVTDLKEGYSLVNEWGDAAWNSRDDLDFRQGIGLNNRFFVSDYKNGTIKRVTYNPETQTFVKDNLNLPDESGNKKPFWVTVTADDAGNVLFRTDNLDGGVVWPGTGGNYEPTKAGFMVLSSTENDIEKIVEKRDVPLTGGPANCRFDALGHISGDILSGDGVNIFATATKVNELLDFEYNACELMSTTESPITISEEFTKAPNVTSLGSAMQIEPGVVAVYGNPTILQTGSFEANGGMGNGIEIYRHDGEKYAATGEFVVTPRHSSIGGFFIFELAGKRYVVYPSGDYASCDAFAIAEVSYETTPKSVYDRTTMLVANKKAAVKSDGATAYPMPAAPVYYLCLNVEPVPDDEYSAYIYVYCMPGVMSKWKFTAPEPIETGVADIEASASDAPVEYFNLQGVRVAEPTTGVYIRRQGDKVAKVVL